MYKLIDGDIQENPGNIKINTILYGYGLDDIISFHNSEDLVKPAYEYGEQSEYYDKDKGLSLFTSAFSNNLKIYGKDVLDGNFEIFLKLDKIVKERVMRYK